MIFGRFGRLIWRGNNRAVKVADQDFLFQQQRSLWWREPPRWHLHKLHTEIFQGTHHSLSLSSTTPSVVYETVGLGMKFSFTLFAAIVSLGSALASNVLELTPDNFDEVIGKGKPALVELCVWSSYYIFEFINRICLQLRPVVWSLQGQLDLSLSRDVTLQPPF